MRSEHSFTTAEPDPTCNRREQLRQQRSAWFAWVCRLHELNSRMPTPESAAVLAIAQRRWDQARQALQRADGEMASADHGTPRAASR